MATHFEARIADQERTYAAQAAQAGSTFSISWIVSTAAFAPTATLRLPPARAVRDNAPERAGLCLPEIAKKMEWATRGAFSVSAAALQTQSSLPEWNLLHRSSPSAARAPASNSHLGAIGKGFALDRMAGRTCCQLGLSLILAGSRGSSVLRARRHKETAGWSCGPGDDDAAAAVLFTHASLSSRLLDWR